MERNCHLINNLLLQIGILNSEPTAIIFLSVVLNET